MLSLKGLYHRGRIHFEEPVPFERAKVIVTFEEELPDVEESNNWQAHLLACPVWEDEDVAPIEQFIEEFRQWKM